MVFTFTPYILVLYGVYGVLLLFMMLNLSRMAITTTEETNVERGENKKLTAATHVMHHTPDQQTRGNNSEQRP